jgi:TolB protein
MRGRFNRLAIAVATASLFGVPVGAYARADEGRIAYLAVDSDPYWQVWVMTGTGRDARQVTHSPYEKARVSWFPDGQRLLVAALDGRLFELSVASGEETPLEIGREGVHDAALSPTGSEVAYSWNPAGRVDGGSIWIAGLPAGPPRRLTRLAGFQHQPAWDPMGEWIYFSSSEDARAVDLWRVSLRTQALQKLTEGALYHLDVAVGPGGRVAYSGNQNGDYEIWLWAPGSGTEAVPLTHHPGMDGGPAWGPGGRDLAFHSMRSGRMQIWRVGVEGGDPRQLTRHEGGARSPAWWFPRARTP